MRTLTTKKRDTVPESLQGILWSVDVKNLDMKENKNYIIHQILMYGELEEIAWLFKVYSKEEVKKVFEKAPLKIYSHQGFHFIKNIILDLKKKTLSPEKYVTTLY